MPATVATDPYDFLKDGGETAALIRGFDWANTALGPVETWPQNLRTTLALALRTPLPVVMLWGEDGILLYNDGYAGFAGARHPSLMGAKVLEGWPEAADLNRRVLDICLGGGVLSLREQRLTLNRNGSFEDCWLDLDYMPILGDDGKPVGVYAVVVEITERIRTEQRLKIAQEAGGVGVFEWYPATGLLDVSDEYRRIWGIPAGVQVTDKLLVDLLHPEDAGLAGTRQLEKANPLAYTEYRRLDPATGQIRWIARQGEAVSAPENGLQRFIGVCFDITTRKAAEDAVRESEARFRTLSQSMPNHVWTATPDGLLDWLNEQVYAYSGAPAGTLNGENWAGMVHPDDIAAAAADWEDARRGGSLYETEFRLRRHDGSYRWHIARAVPARDEAGTIVRWIGTNTDIDDRKAAEAELSDLAATLEERVATRTAELAKTQDALRHSQKMEAIGNLTGGVAHDFNNLLQVISGNLQLLSREITGNDKAEKRVENAMAGVGRGSKLAAQLLAFGRRQPLEPKIVNVGRLIRGMDDLLRRALGEAIEIETIIAGGLWNTLIDPTNVENAILNLAINSRDAMNGQGRLTIEAGNAFLDDAYVRGHADVSAGQYVQISVTDTGSGMSREVMEQVFEPFFSTKPQGKGSGLGLSMVYGFVKQSGGHVKLYSEPDQGTTVKLYLPRSTQAEDIVVEKEGGPVVGGSETILVVEDDEAVRETVLALLGELGYRVLRAHDAQSALAVIESGVPVDLLFTDVVMPGPLKSPELARKAKERLPALSVLFTSGYTENSIVHGGRLDEGVNLLSKPYTREALARKIRHVLMQDGKSPSQDAAPVQPETTAPSAGEAGGATASTGRKNLTVLVCEDDAIIRLDTADMIQDLGHFAVEAENGLKALEIGTNREIDILLTDVGLPDISGGELARRLRAIKPEIAVVFATGRDQVEGFEDAPRTALLKKPYRLHTLERILGTILD